MDFGFNEDNLEIEYNDEKNGLKEDYTEKKELPTLSKNHIKDILPLNNNKNYSFVININSNNIFQHSEIKESKFLYSHNNNQIEKEENKRNIFNKEFLNEESKDNNIDNNIKKNIFIQNKNNIENSSYMNIVKLIIDNKQNIFNNSIIISKNISFINYIISSAIDFNLLHNKKICYLTPDTESAKEIYEIFKDNVNIKSILFQKGKNRKNKNDLQSFMTQLKLNNLFIIIPNILYKLLSIGFVKLSDFGLIIFNECQLCDSNHPYNIIMQEFYFYYFKFPSSVVNGKTLPKIIGITHSPFKDKICIKNEQKGLEILKNISENLDCQIVVDPNIFNVDKTLNEDNHTLIKVKSIFEQKNKVDAINILLMKYFFMPMLDLCVDDYIKINGNKEELNQFNLKKVKGKYLSVIKEKFSKEIFFEYNNQETSERTMHFLSKNSIMFKTFEDIQKMLINIIQNGDLKEFYYLFNKYKELYENSLKNLVESNHNNVYLEKFYKKLIHIFTINKKVFESLINKNIEYKTDRLIKLINKLNEIYSNNEKAKTLILVNNRKMVYILYNYLNRDIPENLNYRNKTKFLVGVNNKKEDNINLTLSTRITTNEINERRKEFNEDKINILICTIPALEYLTKEKCEHILVFSDMISPKSDFEMIKAKAKNSNATIYSFSLESTNNRLNGVKQGTTTNEINENEFIQLNKYFLDKDKNIKNPNNFKSKNYIDNKLLEKNLYYYIGKTEAKMSLKNCMLLFNEISNLYISKNIKINVKKNIKEINKEAKFVCQCDFQWGNKYVQFTSNIYNDKQSAENECFFKYIIYLHKNELIDEHFRIKM